MQRVSAFFYLHLFVTGFSSFTTTDTAKRIVSAHSFTTDMFLVFKITLRNFFHILCKYEWRSNGSVNCNDSIDVKAQQLAYILPRGVTIKFLSLFLCQSKFIEITRLSQR